MNNMKTLNEVFTINPKIQMNLLLNFESYDISTQYEDNYMPEEKLIQFNVDHLKLSFKNGKLRITQERVNGAPKKHNKGSFPYGAYGVIEENGK